MRVSSVRAGALVALAAALSLFNTSVAATQTVDEIVTKHIAARGGYEKIKAIQTIKITRTVATPFSSVTVVTYKKRPNLVRFDQTPKGQTTATPRGINADGAWDIVQGKVVMRPDNVALEGRETDGDFDGLLVDWKEKGHTVTLEGKESIAGSEAHKLKVTTKGGSVRHVFIDAKTFHESGQSGVVLLPGVDPKTKAPRTQQSAWTFGDFKPVDGVMFPHSVDEERTAGPITQSFAHFTEKIEVNVPMEDALFAPPTPPGGGAVK
jgi:hypothetical protein